ncbi:hypothetical protein Trydic_g2254, partial [Trypoxylus dichotomus]
EPTEDPDEPTVTPTEEPVDPTEEPTEDPDESTEEPTEEPVEPTEIPTEEPVEPTEEPDEPTSQCPAVDTEDLVLLPDESDCTIFYICAGGDPILMNCPPGLYFNPTIFVCDHPEDSGCGIEPEEPVEPTEEPTEEPDEPTEEPTELPTEGPTEEPT